MDQKFDMTFDKVARAAKIYFVEKAGYYRKYWGNYEGVYAPAFRKKLVSNPDWHSVERLRSFLAHWSSRTPASTNEPLLSLLNARQRSVSELSKGDLESSYRVSSKMELAQSLFQEIAGINRLGSTTASKILGVVNPSLFVMWDEPIREVYESNGKSQDYSRFLTRMGAEALNVRETCSEGDPEEVLSHKYGSKYGGPFPLANFINYYLWLKYTKKEAL